MPQELTKAEKKIARSAIDKALNEEFKQAMEHFEVIIKSWREGKFTSNKEAYHKIYKAVDEKDTAIASRYNGLTGSRYLVTVAAILYDGYIAEEDIELFSEETKEVINTWITLWQKK
jgi:hypothetical protein